MLSSEAGGTMIHEAVGHGLEADYAQRGLSVYSGRVGEQVASELVTVVDDATLPGRRGTYHVDDEGVPAQRTVLIENGGHGGSAAAPIAGSLMRAFFGSRGPEGAAN